MHFMAAWLMLPVVMDIGSSLSAMLTKKGMAVTIASWTVTAAKGNGSRLSAVLAKMGNAAKILSMLTA